MEEVEGLFMGAGPLERFRYLHLGNDGRADELERILRMGWPVKGRRSRRWGLRLVSYLSDVGRRGSLEEEVGDGNGEGEEKRRLEGMGIRYALDKAPTS